MNKKRKEKNKKKKEKMKQQEKMKEEKKKSLPCLITHTLKTKQNPCQQMEALGQKKQIAESSQWPRPCPTLAHDLSPSCTLHSGFLKQKNPQTGTEHSPDRTKSPSVGQNQRSLGMHSQGLTQIPAEVR